MKVNTAKQKMQQGQPAFGYALAMGSPLVAELFACSGIDFILMDTQHGSWGTDSMIMAMASMNGGSAIPMARVGWNNFTMLGRLLDAGALGVVVPFVNNAADAKAAADACRFPPTGSRSWGWARAGAYGDDYAEWINDQMFVAVQIETKEAVQNAEAILATPGVDGCWVGPGDLSFSIGIHPRDQHTNDEHIRSLEKVLAACRNTGKVPGFACGGIEDGIRRMQQGFRYLTVGSDIGFMMGGAQAGLKQLELAKAKA